MKEWERLEEVVAKIRKKFKGNFFQSTAK